MVGSAVWWGAVADVEDPEPGTSAAVVQAVEGETSYPEIVADREDPSTGGDGAARHLVSRTSSSSGGRTGSRRSSSGGRTAPTADRPAWLPGEPRLAGARARDPPRPPFFLDAISTGSAYRRV